MPPVQREISNKQRDKVYIRQEMLLLYMTFLSISNFSAVERKWLIAKWQKLEQIAGEAFSPEQVVHQRLVSNSSIRCCSIGRREEVWEGVPCPCGEQEPGRGADPVPRQRDERHQQGDEDAQAALRVADLKFYRDDLWKLYYFDETTNDANI